MLAHRRLDVLAHGQAGEQRPLLKQHAPSLADLQMLSRRELVDIVTEDLDGSRFFVYEPQDRPGQHRLAGAGSADKTEHLAAIEVEVEPVHHQVVAEADLEAADADDDVARAWAGVGGSVAQYVTAAKNIANSPSMTITIKIDLTTDEVTHRPSDSADPRTSMPSVEAMRPITIAMNGALMRPTMNVLMPMAFWSRSRKLCGVTPA